MRRAARRPLLAVTLVLPGLLLRALVAPGFMPMSGPDATVSIQVCPGHAPAATDGLDTGGDDDPGNRRNGEAPCVYAATAGGAVVGTLQAPVFTWGPSAPPAVAEPIPPVIERLAPRQFPPRGPPLLQA